MDTTGDRAVYAAPAPRWMRAVAFGLIWVKTALVLFMIIGFPILGGGQDPAGQAYLWGGLVLGGGYWLAVVLPALILARRGSRRFLELSLFWLLLPDAVLVFLAIVL